MHRLSFLSSFRWKLFLALAAVILGDHLFYQNGLFGGHIGLFAFGVLLCLVLGRPSIWRRWQGSLSALSALLFCGALILDPGPLAWTLFWTAISMAALFGMTTPYDDGWLWFQRLIVHAVQSPIRLVMDAIRIGHVLRRPRQRRISLRAILRVVALPLGGSAIILTLFAAANPIITDMLAMIGFPDLSAITIPRLLLWFAIFALIWSLLRARAVRSLIPTFDGSGDLNLPGVSVASVTLSLILFNLLFAVENMLDLAYLSRALPLPEGMTITEYVHRGAYPLIITTLLAGLFVLITLRPGSSTAALPAIRRLVVLWIAQNVILVASSIQRTLDYVEISMLTSLRIHALAWMGLVAAGLLLICWRMLREKSASWLINMNLMLATIVLTFFCFVDAGEMAAWWNVRHAREVTGKGPAIDLCYLGQLGPSALLPLVELESRAMPQPFRERVQFVRAGILGQMGYTDRQGGWTLRNQHRLAIAYQQLRAIRQIRLPVGERDCQGVLVPPPPPTTATSVMPAGRASTLTGETEQ
jgi:hypothetical protein